MRFALMIEPQMGLTYDEQLAIARRAEAAGFETLFRSDHYESFPGDVGRPHDRRVDRGGRPGAGHGADRPGRAGVAGHVPDPGQPRQGRGHGGRDERRARGGGPGRRLARGRAPPARVPVPEIGERADMLEETLEIVHGLWDEPDGWSFIGRHYAVEDALFRPKPGSLPGRDGRQPNILVGGQGTAALVPDRGPLRGRVQPLLDQPRGRGGRSSRSSTTRAAPPGAIRRRWSTR